MDILGDKLLSYKIIDKVKYYDIPNTDNCISKSGVVITGKTCKVASTKISHNCKYVNIKKNDGSNYKLTPVYKILLEVFYGITEENWCDHVIQYDNTKPDKVNTGIIKPMTIEEYCDENRPGIPYVRITSNLIKYLFFKNGDLFNIRLNKFAKANTDCRNPKYTSGGSTKDIKKLLIKHFGTKHMQEWPLSYKLEDGYGFDNLKYHHVITIEDEKPKIASDKDIEIVKYMCKACNMLFKANSLKQVIALDKQCSPCTKYMSANNVDKVDACMKCDCIEIIKS
jgi:hypothetical protein